ncbi:sialate O-acetylesterase [Parapedobacter sp. 10938]|uniref:sialate O-acetylesterase n=1 Tax=Parapedobacter flavus TaxID=3110225 RepID=UPI002DC00A9B|nr:sialate O-acetylesterase [Parapedobacter sp. 10938]MEC3878952.1 sialate O-acetylesterase [Parapedobacter sp. 10938]
MFRVLICLVFLIPAKGFGAARDSLRLADALQSHMVIQQNKPLKIWGTAKPGERVVIDADWLAAPTETQVDEKGDFMGIIPVPAVGKGEFTPHQIRVVSGGEKVALNDLLIGDIWVCSGQSNMQFAVHEMTGAEDVISTADQPHIRLLNVGLNFSDTPLETFAGSWQVCSPETAKDFSAVGYSFGKTLSDSLDIPIGLIFTGIGASGVQAYIPEADLASDTMLNRAYLQPYLADPKSKEPVDGGFSFEKVVRPYLLYNAMVHPLVNLSIKGFIWYQGESNHLERECYVRATQTLITSWRRNFSQGPLPFYYVQIAPFFHDREDPALAVDAFFREAQEQVATLNNTYMVSTMDVGEAKDLHPKNKKPVGERLAAVALNRAYNRLDVVYQGPTVDDVRYDGNKAYIYFKPETLGSGIQPNDGRPPRFFYVAGDDRVFSPAEAVIADDHIVVKSNEVENIVSVRYAFFNYPVTNLENREGFPAIPFRTDTWEEKTQE